MAIPICYVGGGLGATPSTPLESTHGIVNWNRHDRKVRMIPDADAASILRDHPQDFAECVFVEEGYGGMTPEQLREFGAAKSVHVEQYTPKGASDPVDVLVLDAQTRDYIADLGARAKKLTDTGEAETPGLGKPPKKAKEK